MIKEIGYDVRHILTADYPIENHHIVSLNLVRDIMEIIQEQFEDIDISQDELFRISLTNQLEGGMGSSAVLDHPRITDDTLFENYFDSSSSSSGEYELPVSADELDYFSHVQLLHVDL